MRVFGDIVFFNIVIRFCLTYYFLIWVIKLCDHNKLIILFTYYSIDADWSLQINHANIYRFIIKQRKIKLKHIFLNAFSGIIEFKVYIKNKSSENREQISDSHQKRQVLWVKGAEQGRKTLASTKYYMPVT